MLVGRACLDCAHIALPGKNRRKGDDRPHQSRPVSSTEQSVSHPTQQQGNSERTKKVCTDSQRPRRHLTQRSSTGSAVDPPKQDSDKCERKFRQANRGKEENFVAQDKRHGCQKCVTAGKEPPREKEAKQHRSD